MLFCIFAVGWIRHFGCYLLASGLQLVGSTCSAGILPAVPKAFCPRSGGRGRPPDSRRTAAGTAALRFLLRTLVERRRHYPRFHALPADFYFHGISNRRLVRRNIGERDILFQEWRRRTAGDVSNLAAGVIQDLVFVAGNSSIDHFEANQCLFNAL